jgi:MoaA/NifB/PqqE/SkfB family radical SAM enzyme
MGPTGDKYHVLQIHPTRRCNLRCLHCYSSSAPEERDALPIALLRDAVTDAALEGYTIAGLSGGEPILYKDLPELLDHAHKCGLSTTVTSNGMLLDEAKVQMLKGRADLLALSIDGVPAAHNRIRVHERAFETMVSRLDNVRKSRIPFGFIFTLTQHNLDELEWVANFAYDQGASLLQIHPLEEAGRAAIALTGNRPDDTECTFAYLEAQRIQQLYAGKMLVQLDLIHRGMLLCQPDRVFAGECPPADIQSPLASLVSPLVIEADGTVVPVGYGFARQYALGNLAENSLRTLAKDWRKHGYPEFTKLCRTVFQDATQPREMPYFNWYEAVGQKSMEVAAS